MMKRRNQQRRRNKTTNAVGTQAQAQEHLERNKQLFAYPELGFVHPIEHTLLYSALCHPEVYPQEALQALIKQDDDDFDSYILVAAPSTKHNIELPQQYHYGQLTALLAVAAEHWPSDAETSERGNQPRTIPEIVCKRLLKVVVQHAEEHELDRQTEIQEFYRPLERHVTNKNDQILLTSIASQYAGLGASMLLANPLPMFIGLMAGNALFMKSATQQAHENKSVEKLSQVSNRMADVERSGLLDEVDDL